MSGVSKSCRASLEGSGSGHRLRARQTHHERSFETRSHEVCAVNAADVERNAPLAKWTSVRVGGAAELLVRPSSPEALLEVLRDGRPVSLLGGGANTLVGDGGVPGITLKLPSDLFPEQVEGERITLGAGAAIAR